MYEVRWKFCSKKKISCALRVGSWATDHYHSGQKKRCHKYLRISSQKLSNLRGEKTELTDRCWSSGPGRATAAERRIHGATGQWSMVYGERICISGVLK